MKIRMSRTPTPLRQSVAASEPAAERHDGTAWRFISAREMAGAEVPFPTRSS